MDKEAREFMEKMFNQVNIRFDNLSDQFKDLSGEVKILSSNYKDLSTEVKTLSSNYKGLSTEVKGLSAQVKENTDLLKGLEENAKVTRAEIDKISNYVVHIKGDVAAIKKDLCRVEEATANNWADIAKLKAVK